MVATPSGLLSFFVSRKGLIQLNLRAVAVPGPQCIAKYADAGAAVAAKAAAAGAERGQGCDGGQGRRRE